MYLFGATIAAPDFGNLFTHCVRRLSCWPRTKLAIQQLSLVCSHERSEKEREELHSMVTQIMSLTNVAFFGLAGASLKLVRKVL